MQHSASYSAATRDDSARFASEFPEFANFAREHVRQRSDVRSLRFRHAAVARHAHTRELCGATVELESADRIVWIRVTRQDDGSLTAETVIRISSIQD
jgi:hypothetical protein